MRNISKNRKVEVRLLCAIAIIFVLGSQSLSTAQPKAADSGQSKFTTLDGAKVHYVNYGEGSDALVLIHGWTQNIDAWRDQIPDLAKRNRVIAVNLPGHGTSDKPEVKYSMDYFARAVDAVMRDAKVNRGVLVGHSMGTPVARQFYRKYPDKTLAIVIVDGALKPFADSATMNRLIDGFRGPNYKETIAQMFTALTGPNMSAEVKERISTSTRNTPQAVLVSAMEGMADPTIWGDDKISVPVLAVMAKNPFYPADVEQTDARTSSQPGFSNVGRSQPFSYDGEAERVQHCRNSFLRQE